MRWMRPLAGVLVCLCVGCGGGSGLKEPDLAPVSGVVTVKGQPVANLMVQYEPTDVAGGLSFGVTDNQGRFQLKYKGQKSGAPVGTHRVRIQVANEAEAPPEEMIPPKFNTDSQLTATVTAKGPNEATYNLEW